MGKQSSYGNQTPTGSDYVTGVKGTQTASFLFSAILTYIAGAIMAVLSNPYKFSVYRNAAFTGGGGGLAVMVMDTKTYDTGNNFNTTTGLFTAPIDGFYHFDLIIGYAMPSGAGYGGGLYKNGTTIVATLNWLSGNNPSFGHTAVVNKTLQLTAGDTIQPMSYSSGNAGSPGAAATYFEGFLVSKT